MIRALLASLLLFAWPCSGAEIHGAGATFPAPVYLKWAEAYQSRTGIAVFYDAVGSGEGIARIRANAVDFGATDVPLAAGELAAAGLVEFPTLIGGVVPVANVPGIAPGALRLTGALLADIYLGRVRKWNDPAIAALNPGIALPAANITVVHRADASGSTFLWTRYLAAASSAWQDGVGSGLVVAWPAGTGGNGNEGVASYVHRTRFALGYVEYAYAKAHRLGDISLRNREGRFVRAGIDAFRAAAASFDADATTIPIDAPGDASWPVTGASFILLRKDAAASIAFFDWALRDGAAAAEALDYVPLPAPVIDRILDDLTHR